MGNKDAVPFVNLKKDSSWLRLTNLSLWKCLCPPLHLWWVKLLILVPLLSSREGDGTALAFWGCWSAQEGWWWEQVWEWVAGMGGIGQVLVGSHSFLWPSFKYSWSLWPCQVQYSVFWLFACHIVYTVTLKTVPMIGHHEETDQPHNKENS